MLPLGAPKETSRARVAVDQAGSHLTFALSDLPPFVGTSFARIVIDEFSRRKDHVLAAFRANAFTEHDWIESAQERKQRRRTIDFCGHSSTVVAALVEEKADPSRKRHVQWRLWHLFDVFHGFEPDLFVLAIEKQSMKEFVCTDSRLSGRTLSIEYLPRHVHNIDRIQIR